MDFLNSLLVPLEYIVSWIMIGWHWLLAPVFGYDTGSTWALSIVGLVVVIRIMLIPLFVRQIRSSRNMQLLQPQVREIQKKYEGDREAQQAALLSLYKETGTNPFASCLPILLQAPVFFALFRTLNGLGKEPIDALGAFANYPELAQSAANATLFGAPLFATFKDAPNMETKIVAAVLVLIMVVTTFLSQRQLMRKNMPKSALEGPFAQQQKILLYVLPLMFLFSGYSFPIGVVLYWCVSNFWSMGQQFYTIRRMPAPGSEAEVEYKERQAAKAKKKGLPAPEPIESGSGSTAIATVDDEPKRVQPQRKPRSQRKKPPTTRSDKQPGTTSG